MMMFQNTHIVIILLIAALFSGFFYGRNFERQLSYQAAISAYQNAGDIENEIHNLDNYSLCLAAGGLPNSCQIFLRGLEKTTKAQ